MRCPDEPEQDCTHCGGEGLCWDGSDPLGNCPDCTHCGGEGLCWDGSDPLGNCPDEPHPCHACAGSGAGKDQTIF